MALQTGSNLQNHPVVSREEWLSARKTLLEREKEFSRARDDLSRARRELPWVRVEKPYVFEGPGEPATLAQLFEDKSQLLVYHFMFHPDWKEGCPHCSFWADHFDPTRVHLRHRDTTLAVVSRAPLEKIQPFRKRMGWQFPWYSSFRNDFNRDFHVSFTAEDVQRGDAVYNYAPHRGGPTEREGLSVFYRDPSGSVFHTYSCFARGIDLLNGTYNFLDLVPKGRDEDGFKMPQEWVRYHDRYEG
ncbi:MAG: DUF899 domain-containing protein [Bacteroidota bacterium]